MFFFSFVLSNTALNWYTIHTYEDKDSRGKGKHLPICQAAEELNFPRSSGGINEKRAVK